MKQLSNLNHRVVQRLVAERLLEKGLVWGKITQLMMNSYIWSQKLNNTFNKYIAIHSCLESSVLIFSTQSARLKQLNSKAADKRVLKNHQDSGKGKM